MPDTTNKLLTVREVAQQLQMSASWVYKAVARNEMPYLNIGASVRFDPRDVEAFIKGQWQPAKQAKVLPMRRGKHG